MSGFVFDYTVTSRIKVMDSRLKISGTTGTLKCTLTLTLKRVQGGPSPTNRGEGSKRNDEIAALPAS
jgi:hypothetical protein